MCTLRAHVGRTQWVDLAGRASVACRLLHGVLSLCAEDEAQRAVSCKHSLQALQPMRDSAGPCVGSDQDRRRVLALAHLGCALLAAVGAVCLAGLSRRPGTRAAWHLE